MKLYRYTLGVLNLLALVTMLSCTNENEEFESKLEKEPNKRILIDDGPLTDGVVTRYALNSSKWNKKNLTYCFENTSIHLTRNEAYNAVRAAFAEWEKLSDLTFTEINSLSSADLKIAWKTGSHGDSSSFDGNGGVLAHAYYPYPAGGRYAGQLHFDDDEPWSIDGTGIDLQSVALHEIGHLLGIEHTTDSNAIMAPYYTGINRYLAQDDLNAVWSLYSCPFSISSDSDFKTQTTCSVLGLHSDLDVIGWNVRCEYSNKSEEIYQDVRNFSTRNITLANWHSGYNRQIYVTTAIVRSAPSHTFEIQKYIYNCTPSEYYGIIDIETEDGTMITILNGQSDGVISFGENEAKEVRIVYTENGYSSLSYSIIDANFVFDVNGRRYNNNGMVTLYKEDIVNGYILLTVSYNGKSHTFNIPATEY